MVSHPNQTSVTGLPVWPGEKYQADRPNQAGRQAKTSKPP